MRFTQIIDFHTSNLDEMLEVQREWKNESSGPQSRTTVQFCVDRDDPTHCVVMATFDSFEEAMANSERPETAKNAEKMMRLVDGPPRFYNFDVAEESASPA